MLTITPTMQFTDANVLFIYNVYLQCDIVRHNFRIYLALYDFKLKACITYRRLGNVI